MTKPSKEAGNQSVSPSHRTRNSLNNLKSLPPPPKFFDPPRVTSKSNPPALKTNDVIVTVRAKPPSAPPSKSADVIIMVKEKQQPEPPPKKKEFFITAKGRSDPPPQKIKRPIQIIREESQPPPKKMKEAIKPIKEKLEPRPSKNNTGTSKENDKPETLPTKKNEVKNALIKNKPETLPTKKNEAKEALIKSKEADARLSKLWLPKLVNDVAWRDLLKDIFSQPYFTTLEEKLTAEIGSKTVFPPKDLIFNALNLTPLNKVKVVILGQDPYHDDKQAHGLAFSVPRGIPPPPSLKNIYKELQASVPGFKTPSHGCLDKWAKQGVLMLNAFLTVEAHKAGSHSTLGWERFTNDLLAALSTRLTSVVFVFWGKFAAKKQVLLASDRGHLVLVTGHPSPLSVRHFLGCRHFVQIDDFLRGQGKGAIDWTLEGGSTEGSLDRFLVKRKKT